MTETPAGSAREISRRIRTVRDLDLYGKQVFLRVDLNVPLGPASATEGEYPEILDENRITEALPTIQYAIEKGAKVILASHLGRPKGRDTALSLAPVAQRMAALLDADVTLADECVGEGIELMAKNLHPGQVMMLENLRFHAEEEKNDRDFVQGLARLTEVYVTDAFGTAHRKHASTFGLAEITPARGAGFLIEKELHFLEPLLHRPNKPFYVILGGAKVSDKIKTIRALMQTADAILVGGAMAFAFDRARGVAVPEGARQPSEQDVASARELLAEAKRRELQLLLPSDTRDGFDIGPETVREFSQALARAKTVFWNGPLGWFEKPEYAAGTRGLAEALGQMSAVKIVGGGDTVAAITQFGLAPQFDHLSTGGGAVLEYLEGNGLPGIEILKTTARPAGAVLK